MSLISHSFFPRSMFDMDQWFRAPYMGPSTLDLFDPFDELDRTISRNLHWLTKPEFLNVLDIVPRVPQKYRITVDCAGYKPGSIKTEFKDNKLQVSGREEHRTKETDDYSVREFKKTYDLPANVESDKMVSFMATGGKLVIEFPLKETQLSPNADLFPQIIDTDKGKAVQMKFSLPENIDPSKVNVSVKDRDLIFRVEDRVEKPDASSRFYFYKRTTLPENTEFDQLKCVQDKNQITIQAPLDMDFARSYRNVPIEKRAEQPQITQSQSQQQQQPQRT